MDKTLIEVGIPYLGSKRKLAREIIKAIIEIAPKTKYFYDLFGGGGAISFQALQEERFTMVHYNEINSGVVALLEDIQKNGVTEKYFRWIDRESFFKNKNKDCWIGGFCKTIWSFGNAQRYYLYGKEREIIKKEAHKYIINRCNNAKKELEKRFNIQIERKENSLFSRIEEYDPEMERKRLQKLVPNRLLELEHLQRVNQLKKIATLEQLELLKISNFSYEKVEINTPPRETVIYLDPPYDKKEKYQDTISRNELIKHIDKMHKRGFTVIVSEYKFDELKEFKSMNHLSSLRTKNGKRVIEKLFHHQDFKPQ